MGVKKDLDGEHEWFMRAWEWGQGSVRDSKKGQSWDFRGA